MAVEILSPTSPLDTPKILGGSIETLPAANNNGKENEANEGGNQLPKRTMPIPDMMRHRAASTGSVLTRRDSTLKGVDDHNRTMLFQVSGQKL